MVEEAKGRGISPDNRISAFTMVEVEPLLGKTRPEAVCGRKLVRHDGKSNQGIKSQDVVTKTIWVDVKVPQDDRR